MIPASLSAQLDSISSDERRLAVVHLGDLGDADSVIPLVRALEGDTDPYVRAAAITSLSQYVLPDSLIALYNATDSEDQSLQQLAVTVLRELSAPDKFGGPFVLALTPSFNPIRLILASVEDRAVIRQLDLADVESSSQLVDDLARGLPTARIAAALVLGKRRHDDIAALARSLADPHAAVRLAARAAIANLGDDAVGPLVKIFSTAGEVSPNVAGKMLGALGTVVVPELAKYFRRNDPRLRRTAAFGLQEIHDADAVELLLKWRDDPDPEVVATTARALGFNRLTVLPKWQQQVVPWLEGVMLDPQKPITRSAAYALASTGGELAAKTLVKGLERKKPEIRFEVARALARTAYFPISEPAEKGWLAMASTPRGVEVSPYTGEIIKVLKEQTRDPIAGSYVRGALAKAQGVMAVYSSAPNIQGGAYAAAAPAGSQMPPTPPPSSPIKHEVARPKTPPRVVDINAYLDSAGTRSQKLHPPTQPLESNQWYWLEVAVVPPGARKGVKGKIGGIAIPEQKEPVRLDVTVESKDFDFDQLTAQIDLPVTGASTKNAYFRFRASAGAQHSPGSIVIRLFYRLNLLQCLRLTWGVKTAGQRRAAKPQVVEVEAFRPLRRFEHMIPRQLSIHSEFENDSFALTFTLDKFEGGKQPVTFVGKTTLSKEDLEDSIVGSRRLLEDITMKVPYATQPSTTDANFAEALKRLSGRGTQLRQRLFFQNDMQQIGTILKENPLAEGRRIEVILSGKGPKFLFPWSLIYDAELPKDRRATPDPNGFWGFRYIIEQHLSPPPESDEQSNISSELNVAFMLCEEFDNWKDEVDLLDKLVSRSKGRLKVSHPPITQPKRFLDEVPKGQPQILYFYTHGHTSQGSLSPSDVDPLAYFSSQYLNLKEDDPARPKLTVIYNRIKSDTFEPHRSWISLTEGKLYYDQIAEVRLQSRPFVFLNMCESAQAAPALKSSFVDLFFSDRVGRAAAVLGTECQMTTAFAHPFAEIVLSRLMAGVDVGQALLDARRHFRDQRNPLGLAYTLFGSSFLAFKPPRILS